MVFKVSKNDSSEDKQDMAYVTRRFQKMVRSGGFQNKENSSKDFRGNGLCHKCGKLDHYIKKCSLLK